MEQKTLRILLSILHVCIACIGILLLLEHGGGNKKEARTLLTEDGKTVSTKTVPAPADGIGPVPETEEAAGTDPILAEGLEKEEAGAIKTETIETETIEAEAIGADETGMQGSSSSAVAEATAGTKGAATASDIMTDPAGTAETSDESRPAALPADDGAQTFQYTGQEKHLNIRKGPSTKEPVIGKIPLNGRGVILELTDNGWALIDYNGVGFDPDRLCGRGYRCADQDCVQACQGEVQDRPHPAGSKCLHDQ